jgi:hypothetical protein
VSRDQVASCDTLAGGTFNSVCLVRLADGTGLVVKIPYSPQRREWLADRVVRPLTAIFDEWSSRPGAG